MALKQGQVSGSSRIPATPARVYSVIADYNQHHPRICPPEYFKRIEVEEGGVGAGTRIKVTMRVLGTETTFRHNISEPEPGRVLVESDPEGASETTFTVDPIDTGRASNLTISTRLTSRHGGILGSIEISLSTFMLRRIYAKELALISDYAARMERQSST